MQLLCFAHLKPDHRLESPRERLVQMRAQIRVQDHDSRIILDALQQIGDLLVGGAVVAPAEQGVGFVEEQDPVFLRRAIEYPPQVLFRLADVFRDQRGKIDAPAWRSQARAMSFAASTFPDPGEP